MKPAAHPGRIAAPATTIALAVFAASGAIALRPTDGAAQDAVSSEPVTCESIRMRRKECPVPAGAEVRLVTRLGPSPCRRGTSWGVEGAALWVDQGCRGRFAVVRSARASVVPCGSSAAGRVECATEPGAEVVLLRQGGGAPCVRGRTWGYEDGVIWTEGGCQAEFEVTPRDSLVPKGPVLLICESIGGRRTECLTPGEGEVRLSRRLSDAPCERDRSWGVTGGRVWVSAGCRGEFEVRGP